MAERKGSLFRRRLASADRLSDRAILFGSSHVKTPSSRSRARLVSVTRCDHPVGSFRSTESLLLRRGVLAARFAAVAQPSFSCLVMMVYGATLKPQRR